MKILKKRAIALIVDSSLIAFVFAGIDYILGLSVLEFQFFKVLFYMIFFFKDIVFKNASIGKKIMGIEIYDLEWKVPNIMKLFVRSMLINTIGIIYVWKAKFIDGSMIYLIDFERERCKTRVIDKKILEKLRKEARAMEGNENENLTKLYDEYLRSIYIK